MACTDLPHSTSASLCATRVPVSRSDSSPICAPPLQVVRSDPDAEGGMAPIYGMANTIPDRGVVADALLDHIDSWYRLR